MGGTSRWNPREDHRRPIHYSLFFSLGRLFFSFLGALSSRWSRRKKTRMRPSGRTPSTRFPSPQTHHPLERREKGSVEWKRKSCVTAGKTWLEISFLLFPLTARSLPSQ